MIPEDLMRELDLAVASASTSRQELLTRVLCSQLGISETRFGLDPNGAAAGLREAMPAAG